MTTCWNNNILDILGWTEYLIKIKLTCLKTVMWLRQHFKLRTSHIPIGLGCCLRHVCLGTLAGKSSQRENSFPSGAQATRSPNISPEHSWCRSLFPPTAAGDKGQVYGSITCTHSSFPLESWGHYATLPSQTTFFLIGWFRKNRNWVRPTKLRILSYHLKGVWSWASYVASFHVWSPGRS